ncbi:hypothetical protein Prudu_45S000400 [Prunus dulcis]|uniref:Pectin lyase-like superfamily protein n=1 Tax=Prunus dulcis TaxID=3755 RepID=A0A5H2XFR3_PRUDU|nr:hypothetical protein Prudu_45S000400 [Prunus dulcis]
MELIASSDYRILGQSFNWLSFEGVTSVSIIEVPLMLKVPPCGHASWLEALIAPTEEPRLVIYAFLSIKEILFKFVVYQSLLFYCFLNSDIFVPTDMQSLSFTNSKNININGLMSLNSQMFHIARIKGVKVNAAGNIPNTDGIHVQLSRNVAIFNTSIKTGDNCVSIGPGRKDLWIEQITCGPGHDIRSILYSLGLHCLHMKTS